MLFSLPPSGSTTEYCSGIFSSLDGFNSLCTKGTPTLSALKAHTYTHSLYISLCLFLFYYCFFF